jgi:hypothetical protein
VPLNVLLKGPEISYRLKTARPKHYFCFQGTFEPPMAMEGWADFNDVPEYDRRVIWGLDFRISYI